MITEQNTIADPFKLVKAAARTVAHLNSDRVNNLLISLATAAVDNTEYILQENKKDLDRMDTNDPKYDRLQLTPERIQAIAAEINKVAELPSPLAKTLEKRTMDNGMMISRVTVPLGVIGIIYEARPNVTFDVFSLCIKSGNACILKGGSDASFSNIAIGGIIKKVLKEHDLPEYAVALLPATREATTALLNAVGDVDVIIPRGSQQLINFVRKESRVPVIETGAGIVHAYFDESGDLDKARGIVYNSKTRRVSVCNALDCLLVHTDRLPDLPAIVADLAKSQVTIYADEAAYAKLENRYPAELLQLADESHFGTEFLDYKMAIKTVSDIAAAIDHIAQYSSKHSETIISENEVRTEQFLQQVDAAVVYANVSTAFTDGGQFGLGAEIGISTQKLHARGPMALSELCSYKWVVRGDGQVRR